MSWKVRTILVLAAAGAIYGLVAWMISSKPGPTHQELEGRVAALELALEQSLLTKDAQAHAGPRAGSLYDTLQANLQTGRSLLMNWPQDKIVQHLGWPDVLQAQRWGYAPRFDGDQFLQLVWNESGRVSGVLWFPEAPPQGE